MSCVPHMYHSKMSDKEDVCSKVSNMSSLVEMEDCVSTSSDNNDWEQGNSGYTCEPEYTKEELVRL